MIQKTPSSNNRLVQYLSYGIQLMAAVGIGIWLGYWLDRKLHMTFPIFVWVLPTLLLVMMLISLVRTFSKQQKNKDSSSSVKSKD